MTYTCTIIDPKLYIVTHKLNGVRFHYREHRISCIIVNELGDRHNGRPIYNRVVCVCALYDYLKQHLLNKIITNLLRDVDHIGQRLRNSRQH